MLSNTKHRFWYWRLAHYLSIVRYRRRVVFALVLLGILAAIIVTKQTMPVYSSRALVQIQDMPTNTDEIIHAVEYSKTHPGTY